MKELSEHILDIAQNSVAAGAANIGITLTEDEAGWLTVVIADDGRGMSPEFLSAVTDPFTTTRTTRKVGLGLPLYRQTAEQTGGSLQIRSAPGAGTTVTAVFDLGHLDCPPLGDIAGTIALLVQGSPELDIAYWHTTPAGTVELSTREMRQLLGGDISLAEPEVFAWLNDYLSEQEARLEGAEAR
ncbi:MAG: ATP-binding protein [Candidatus Enterenecus sp.]